MSNSSTDSMLIETPCRLDAVRDAARSLRSFLAAHGAQETELDEWELVAVEAGNNAVQYAPPGRGEEGVRFLMNAWPDSVELCVTDHSQGFDLPEHADLPADDSEHGRGLFLMNALTDSMRYVRGHHENTLILRKNRPRRSSITDVQRDADIESTLHSMTEELGASFESLAAIFSFSADLGRADNARDCAAKWLNELLKVTRMDWYVLRRYRDDTGSLEVLACSPPCAGGAEPEGTISTRPEAPRSVEVFVTTHDREIWFDSARDDFGLGPLAGSYGAPLCGVAYPIHVAGELYGVLSIGMRATSVDFSVSQINLVHTFADFLGIQLHNDEARQEAIKSKLMHKELEVAGDIQRSLLPKDLPILRGFTLSAYSQSASAVGGDFYDVVQAGNDGVLFAIADVMGKGVPAAMFAAMFRSHLRACSEMMQTPARMLAWLNRALFADLDGVDMFVTAQLAYIHWPSRTLIVASAGHCPALLVDGTQGTVSEVIGDGPPLGIARDTIFRAEKVHLAGPARLLMVTDGLLEARNREGEPLGQSAVTQCLLEHSLAGDDAACLRDALLALASGHQQGTPATDDLTFLVLAENSPT